MFGTKLFSHCPVRGVHRIGGQVHQDSISSVRSDLPTTKPRSLEELTGDRVDGGGERRRSRSVFN